MKKLIAIFISIATLLAIFVSPVYATEVYFSDIPLSEEIQTYLYNRCVSEGVSFDLIVALIGHESEFKKYAVSPTGDHGLCQINLAANEDRIEKLGVYSLYDEYSNIDIALDILSGLYSRYEDTGVVLMAYNMGETGARRLWEQGVWETEYSVSIMTKSQSLDYEERMAQWYES